MSYGKLNSFIEIVSTTSTRDAEGFAVTGDATLANVRAYFEPKNSTEKWRNNAVFAEATALFRFRCIPGMAVATEYFIICEGIRYNILSAENVRGKNLWYEVLGKAVNSSG